MTIENSKGIIFNFAPYARRRLVVLGSFFTLIFAFCIFAVNAASAATLYFSPSSGNFTVGNILNASVLVNTQGQAINNSGAVINFPTKFLEVVSVSKSGSIFSLWVEEPAFSNSAGVISFDGGLPTPGYNGSSGRLLNITFRVKSAGTASLVFSSGAVRANDGYGTDILQTRAEAQFGLISEERPVVLPPVVLGTPQAPSISSPTHPDRDKWYLNSAARFTWSVPSGVTGVRVLVSKIPSATPAVTYAPAISEKEITDLADGIWYFHAQFRNASGWGAVSHFRFQIDTENPERFDIREVVRSDLTEPKVKFVFDASDKISGIDHYEVQIGNESPQIWQDNGGHKYETPDMIPGKYILIAKAVDRAGNSLANSAEFIIKALEPPVITEYPKQLPSGESLVVKGTTKYANAQTTVWFEQKGEEAKSQIVRNDANGNFTLVADTKLKDGIYKVWAEVIDERGARSNPSEKVTISIERPAFLKLGSRAVILLAVVVPLVALIFIFLFIIWFGWHKFTQFRKKLQKEVQEAEDALHRAFDLLKEDIQDQIKMLEKAKTRRELTEEEAKILKQFRAHLGDAERFIRKEIKDIEEQVNQ